MNEHHPSCTPNDLDLVFLCAQCGGHEPATIEKVEAWLSEQGERGESDTKRLVKAARAKLLARLVDALEAIDDAAMKEKK